MFGEERATDALAAHVYGWESDIAIAEERLEQEIKRGHLVSFDNQPINLRSSLERARAMLEPPLIRYSELSDLEKEIIRYRAYMTMRDQEEAFPSRRGRGLPITGYEIVFSLDVQTSNRVFARLIENFLTSKMDVTFSKARGPEKIPNPLGDLPAAITIHRRGTENNHAHVLFDCRKADGTLLQIPPQVWRSFDIHWARIWAEHVREPEQLREHLEKKLQTEDWKRETRERKQRGLTPNPKPERAADTRDQRFLKLCSQIKTDLRTIGLDPDKFRVIERLPGSRSNEATRQLMAEAEVARQEFMHALATGGGLKELRDRSNHANELRLALSQVQTARGRVQENGKKDEPPFYYTDKQSEFVGRLEQERQAAAPDDRATGLLVGYRNYFREQEKSSRHALEEFMEGREHSRLLTEEGSARRSLKEIDTAIIAEKESRARFVGEGEPEKNSVAVEASQLKELQRERAEVEARYGEREAELHRAFEYDGWRHHLAREALKDAAVNRIPPGLPAPIYTLEVYHYLDQLAHREGDAELAQHLWIAGREYRLAPERLRETTEVELGREYVARWRSLVAEEDYHQVGKRSQNTGPTRKEAAREAAIKYDGVRGAIVDQCLARVSLSREEIVPRFAPDEFGQFKEGVSRMIPGEIRAEFEEVVKRVEAQKPMLKGPDKLKQQEKHPAGTLRIQENDPQARAGILRGEYLYAWAKFVEKLETKQDYSAELKGHDRAKREMEIALGHYRQVYGKEPKAILNQEQNEYIETVIGRFVSYQALQIRNAVHGALVIGHSKADQPLDYSLPERTIQDRAPQPQPQRDAQTRESKKSRGHSGKDRR